MISFNRLFFILAAGLAVLAAIPPAFAADWQVAAAPWRIEAVPSWAYHHDLFVPVPAELGSSTPSAFQTNGQPLPFSPVMVGGQLAGVELEIPEGAPPRSCFVYLTPGPGPAAPARQRRPVIRQSWDAGMTTRPITLAEICRLMAEVCRLTATPKAAEGANSETLASIPTDLNHSSLVCPVPWPNVHNAHNKLTIRIVHLYTQLKQEKAGPLVFSVANNNRIPFCLFIDGQPLLIWAAEAKGSQVSNPAATVSAGLHRLDFYVMVRAGQSDRDWEICPIPLLANAENGVPAPERLVSPLIPLRFALQRRDGFEAVRVNFEDSRLLWGRDNQVPILFLPGGVTVPAGIECAQAGTHVFAGLRLAPFSITDKRAGGGTFSFPALQPEARLLSKWPELSLLTLPAAIAAHQDLRFTLNLTLSRSLREMQAQLFLSQTYKDHSGRILETTSVPLPAETSVPWTVTARPPPEKACVLELQLLAGKQPLTAIQPIHLVSPDADLGRLTAKGDRLLFGDEPAVLRCHPIVSSHPRLSGKKLAWYDEAWFTCQAPGADLTPETVPAPAGIREVRLETPPPTGTGEMARELVRHAKIARLVNADLVVWSLQAPPGSVYETQRPFLTECLFLAQACQAHGCGAIFISPPPLPGTDPEAGRLATLWMKELGMRAGFTVIDLYSSSQLDHAGEGPLANPFAGGPAGTILASPGNAARSWTIQKVFETINP